MRSVRRRPVPRRAATAVACVAAGLALAAAVPPWGWWPLALVGLVGFERLIAGRPARSRFRRGLLVGAAWLYPSTLWMLDFSPPGYLVAGAVFAAFVGVGAYMTPPGRGRRLALPAAVALVEFARSSVPFGGVPLSTIAMSQARSPLAPLARLGGGLLLTLAVGTAAVALAALVARAWPTAILAAVVVAVAALAASFVPRSHDTRTVSVALVQGGGPQRTRAVSSDPMLVFQRHLDASQLVRTPVDLVVWPENVVTLKVPLADSADGQALSALAQRLDATVVPGVTQTVDAGGFTNYSVVVNPDGSLGARYDKVQRVPFGEYVPLRGLVNTLSGGTVDRLVPRDAIPGDRPAFVDSEVGRLGVAISWEIFFERRSRDAISHGGEVLLNPTNGSSYWLAIVQSQQVASSRLRALETDRWVLQAAPTGFSAIVDPDGRVVQRTGIGDQAVLQADIGLRDGLTPAVRWGPLPWLVLATVVLAAGWTLQVTARSAQRAHAEGQASEGEAGEAGAGGTTDLRLPVGAGDGADVADSGGSGDEASGARGHPPPGSGGDAGRPHMAEAPMNP